MKTKTILITFISLVATSLFVFQSCIKEEDTNIHPTCEILLPTNGQEISQGSIVNVSIGAVDSDGSITEVSFIVDGVIIGSLASPPYVFSWNTSNEILGNHLLSATCIDNSGETASTEISVLIVQVSAAPLAGFSANITSGDAPLTVNFTDQSTNSPISWEWNFGDGETANTQNPEHIYNQEGDYNVSLTVSNNFGSSVETKTNYIMVSNGGSTGSYTDPRDGKTYTTVQIGDQIWMAQNLNYESVNSWWYDNDISNGDIYGRLYTFEDANIVCSDGWHLPTDDEWKTLEISLGMAPSSTDGMEWRGIDEGEKMKTTYGWPENGNGTNSSGFSALPGGTRTDNGYFNNVGGSGYWWTATEYNSSNSWYRMLNNTKRVWREYRTPYSAISVRCVKDN